MNVVRRLHNTIVRNMAKLLMIERNFRQIEKKNGRKCVATFLAEMKISFYGNPNDIFGIMFDINDYF